MKSIAVTKPDMGVLSRDRLPLSPFGALSQAFGEELLARAEQTEGAWSYVPLELLEEGEEAAPPAPPVKPVLQVNLQLVLEALRREGRRTEQQRATERIVERILQMQDRPASRQEKEKSPARTPAQSLSVFGTVRQEFHPTFIQNIRISAPPPSQPKPMGELARKAENLSQRLQTLREEGAPPPQETRLAQGQMVPLRPHEEAPRFMRQVEQVSSRPLPQEALTLLEEQGDEAAQTVSRVQGKELLRRADQVAHQVEKVLTESAKSVANPPASAGKHQEPDTSNQSRRTPQRDDTGENQRESRKQDKKTSSHAPVAQGTSVPQTTLGETAARDIRVSSDTPLGSTAVQEHFGATAKQQTMGQGSAAPMAAGTSMVPGQLPGAPAVSGQGAIPSAPLDLSLRTEGEKVEEAGQIFHKVSPTVEKTGAAEGKRPSPPASAQEKVSHSNVQPQTAARDIRVSPDTPLGSVASQEHLRENTKQTVGQMGAAPIGPGTPIAPGAPMAAGTSMVPGQLPGAPAGSRQGTVPPAPLDLSLRTEEEKAEGAEKAGQISHKTSHAVEKTGEAESKQPSPPASAQEKTSHSSVQPQTAARDIRVSSDIPMGSVAAQEYFGAAAKQQAMGHESAVPMVPGAAMAPGTSMISGQLPGAPAVSGQGAIPPTPLDLSLRTEGEKAKEVGQISHKVSPAVEKTGTAEGKQPSPPASAQEKNSHSSVQPQTVPTGKTDKTAQTVQTAARDIRVRPDTSLGSVAAQKYFEATAKQQAMGQMGAAPMVPGTSMVPGQMPGAPVVSGQGAVSPAPLDLSLRTEGEKAEEAGQTFHKTSSDVEKTGAAEGKQSSPPALAREKAAHSNVQPQTAARDIRVSPDTPLSSMAAQEYFGAAAKQQAMGQMGTTPMVPGTSMVPGQMPGAPEVSGQGAVPPAPLDLSLRTEGENVETARQAFHKTSSAVEKTGTTEGRPSPSPALAREKADHSNIQPQMTWTSQAAAAGRQTAQSPQTSRFGTQNHPSPWGPRTAARDIRTGPALGHAVSDGKGAEAWMAPSLPLTWSQPHQEEPAAQPFAARQVQAGAQAAAAAQRGTSSMAEPLSLTYGPVQGSTETPPPEPEAAQPTPGEESEFVRSLPDWARRFLKQSRSSSTSHIMGVARDIATVPMPEETEDVQWTAPNYRPPQATIAHREKKQEERPKAVQEVRISEAEIQRTADRVYRIIEDRIRLERRRLGL